MAFARKKRTVGTIAAAVLISTGLVSVGPAEAADEDHTVEKFTETIGPFHDEFGFNPCTGVNDTGFIVLTISGEIEIQDGREHGSVNTKATFTLDNGFKAELSDEQDAEIDAEGNGKVIIQTEVRVWNESTEERFEVHVGVVLIIDAGELVDVVVSELVGPCERG